MLKLNEKQPDKDGCMIIEAYISRNIAAIEMIHLFNNIDDCVEANGIATPENVIFTMKFETTKSFSEIADAVTVIINRHLPSPGDGEFSNN